MIDDALELLRKKAILLNGRADQASIEIGSVNDRLAQIQPGIETWLAQPVPVGDETIRLGYARVEGGWQLVVRRAKGDAMPLRLESRTVRICAAPFLLALVKAITTQMENLLQAITTAKRKRTP
jgi:hypothetical protein